MSELIDRIGRFVQQLATGPAALPRAVAIPAGRCRPEGSAGTPIIQNHCYLTLTINELFLANARKGWADYQPMVLSATSFIRQNTTVTVPAVVGPSLLQRPHLELPAGLLLNDIEVAGPFPYKGGNITVSILLYRVKHGDYARSLLRLLEGVSTAIGPAADLGLLGKVGGTLLDGIETVIGLADTEPVMGHRFALSPVGPGGLRTFYAALLGDQAVRCDDLSVVDGRLHAGNGPDLAEFTQCDYVLYSLSAPTRRTDETTLPFYGLFERARADAFRGGEVNWKAAKATLSELWQEMMLSADLTPEQAAELFGRWKADVVGQKELGEATAALSAQPPAPAAVDERTRGAADILDL
jgi:hypothetical protein